MVRIGIDVGGNVHGFHHRRRRERRDWLFQGAPYGTTSYKSQEREGKTHLRSELDNGAPDGVTRRRSPGPDGVLDPRGDNFASLTYQVLRR